MKKVKFLILALLLLSLTSCSLQAKDSVTLSGEEYEEYLKNKEMIDKLDYLTEVIEDDFLFESDEDKMEAGIYKGLFESLDDPYSVYYTKDEFEKLLSDTSGEFGGIGIVVTAQEDFLTVVSPIEGTPGQEAGLKTGDKIIAINGDFYMAKDLEEAVDQMRGEPGTDLTIRIRREGEPDRDIKLTRDIIKVESVFQEQIGDYSYINISNFDENTAGDFTRAIQEASKNSKGVILDLRNNPGGLLDSVVDVADLLLPKGTIVSTIDKNSKEEKESSDENMVGIDMVVLINEGSASASEILAAALQDYNRAKIIGKTSFGKGIVQKVYGLEDGGYKLTVSEYYSPAGKKIHEKGVSPDIEVDLSEDTQGIGPGYLDQDDQLQKAIEVLDAGVNE